MENPHFISNTHAHAQPIHRGEREGEERRGRGRGEGAGINHAIRVARDC